MSLPPGPTSWAPWQLIQRVRSPHAFMRACVASYGDLFTLRIGYGLAPLACASS